MQSCFLSYRFSSIHYYKSGNGKQLLFCFHGYSQSALSFEVIEKEIENDFTMIAIDFPFHGKTEWKEGLHFTPADLLEIIENIRKEVGISPSKIHLLGYSMGGRVALGMMPFMKDKIDRLILLAADGLKVNFWYWLSTQTSLGNRLFKYLMSKPQFMFKALELANKMNIVNQSIYKFLFYYIHVEQVRRDLYKRWTTMRDFRPDIHQTKMIISEQKILVKMLYGEHDRIIRFERGEKFRRGLEPLCTIKVIKSGHLLITKENAPLIAELIKR